MSLLGAMILYSLIQCGGNFSKRKHCKRWESTVLTFFSLLPKNSQMCPVFSYNCFTYPSIHQSDYPLNIYLFLSFCQTLLETEDARTNKRDNTLVFRNLTVEQWVIQNAKLYSTEDTALTEVHKWKTKLRLGHQGLLEK